MKMKNQDLPAHWVAGLQDERIRFLLQAAWLRLPAPTRSILPALVHEVTDSEAAPIAEALAAVGEQRIHRNQVTVKLWLTGAKAIRDPNACTWVLVHALAHVVQREELGPKISKPLQLTTKTPADDRAAEMLCDVLCAAAADILAACAWGFLLEFRAFLVEFPLAYQAAGHACRHVD